MSNAIPTNDNAQYIDRIKVYLAEKKKWKQGVPSVGGPAGPILYEKFIGDRGDWIGKTKKRLDTGVLQGEESRVAEQKTLADTAFRSGHFQEAAELYTRATEVWGHPHNAVCYSNLAATFLKLQKWSDAEVAAQKALREHLSMHGTYYGLFHVKAFHRLGLAHIEMGRYEVAETYFRKALIVSPNNAAVNLDSEVARKHLEAVGTDLLARASKFGLTEQEVECVMEAGAKPWDEDVQDLLERGGLRPDSLEPQYTEVAYYADETPADKLDDPRIRVGCSYCHRRGTTMPLGNCHGCDMAASCSERCSILYWATHESTCMDNRRARNSLPRAKPDELFNFMRTYRFTVNNRDALNQLIELMLCAPGDGGVVDTTVFERFVGVVDIDYDPDLTQPTRVVGVRKMAIAEIERQLPELKGMGKRLKEMGVLDRQRGYLGEAAVVVRVQDKESQWSNGQVQTFTMPQNAFDNVVPSPAGWKKKWVRDVNEVENSRL